MIGVYDADFASPYDRFTSGDFVRDVIGFITCDGGGSSNVSVDEVGNNTDGVLVAMTLEIFIEFGYGPCY